MHAFVIVVQSSTDQSRKDQAPEVPSRKPAQRAVMSGCWGGTGELAQAGEVMTTQFKRVEMHTQVHSCSPFGGKQPGLHFWLQRISDHLYLTCRMGLMTRKVAWMACGSTVTAGLWISQSMTYRMCRATTHIVSALGCSPPALVLPLRSRGCMVQQT